MADLDSIRLPWFQFWQDDFESSSRVRMMGPVARTYYLTLLIHQWRYGYIPADPGSIKRLLTMPKDPQKAEERDFIDYSAVLSQVLECFEQDDKGLVNPRMHKMRETALREWRKKSEAGKKFGFRRVSDKVVSLADSSPSSLADSLATSTPVIDTDSDTDKTLEPKAKALRAVKEKFVLPDWVPEQNWRDYEEMRNRIRKPMTDKARGWAVALLGRLRKLGHDPEAVLNQSVFNCWQGLFEVKDGTNRGNHQERPVNAQVARWHNNRAERERARAAVVGQAGNSSNGQETRFSAGNPPVLDGEIKKLQ